MTRDQRFSTHDQENEVNPTSTTSCAIRFNGAWWYNSPCLQSNLNGLYLYGDANPPDGESVVWYEWRGFKYSLKATEMKMRPKQCEIKQCVATP